MQFLAVYLFIYFNVLSLFILLFRLCVSEGAQKFRQAWPGVSNTGRISIRHKTTHAGEIYVTRAPFEMLMHTDGSTEF